MEWNRENGSGKRYYVTDHALKGPGHRPEGRPDRYVSERFSQARQWKYRRSVDGEHHFERNAYEIAEGSCYMADFEFDADGAVTNVRYDLVRPAGKA